MHDCTFKKILKGVKCFYQKTSSEMFGKVLTTPLEKCFELLKIQLIIQAPVIKKISHNLLHPDTDTYMWASGGKKC